MESKKLVFVSWRQLPTDLNRVSDLEVYTTSVLSISRCFRYLRLLSSCIIHLLNYISPVRMLSLLRLMDLLQVDRSLGYKPSFSSGPTTNRTFADDLTLLSDRLDKMKRLIERIMEEFLASTRTM